MGDSLFDAIDAQNLNPSLEKTPQKTIPTPPKRPSKFKVSPHFIEEARKKALQAPTHKSPPTQHIIKRVHSPQEGEINSGFEMLDQVEK